MTSGSVVVVGSINIDLTVHVPRIPRAGETVLGGDVSRAWGGKGANQAVAAAGRGARVVMIGAVGDDEHGRGCVSALRSSDVDTGLVMVTDRPTGLASIVVDAQGENAIAVAPGANDAVSIPDPTEVRALTGNAPGVVLVSLEIPLPAVGNAARLADHLGWMLILNPAPARDLPEEVLDRGPILVPNRGEAEQLSDSPDPTEAAAKLSSRTGAPTVVTCGGEGAVLYERGHATVVAAPSVDVVDTTGAGDAFVGALAAVLAVGSSLDTAVRAGVEAGAAAVSHHGARR